MEGIIMDKDHFDSICRLTLHLTKLRAELKEEIIVYQYASDTMEVLLEAYKNVMGAVEIDSVHSTG